MKKILSLLFSIFICSNAFAQAQILSGTAESNNFVGTSLAPWTNITPVGTVTDIVIVTHVYWNLDNITQVVYGNSTCLLVDRQTGNNYQSEDLWLCHNPAQGTQSIQMSIESGSHRVFGYVIPYSGTNGIGNYATLLYTMASSGAVHLTNRIALQSSNNLVTSYINWVAINTFPIGFWNTDNILISTSADAAISYQIGNGTMDWSTINAWGNSKIAVLRAWEMISLPTVISPS